MFCGKVYTIALSTQKDTEGLATSEGKRIVYLQCYRSRAGGGESRLRSRRRVPGPDSGSVTWWRVAPDIGGGSSRFGKKAGRSDVVTGVLRSVGVPPAVGAGAGFKLQSKPRAPTSASESRWGPTGSSASVPIPSGTTCSSAQGPIGITNNASVKTASRAAGANGTGAARPRTAVLSMEPRSHIR